MMKWPQPAEFQSMPPSELIYLPLELAEMDHGASAIGGRNSHRAKVADVRGHGRELPRRTSGEAAE